MMRKRDMDIGSVTKLKEAYLGMPVRDRLVLVGQVRDKFLPATAERIVDRLLRECAGPPVQLMDEREHLSGTRCQDPS